MSSVFRANDDHLWVRCPACEETLRLPLGPNGWTWDGNEETPTLAPSILVHEIRYDDGTVYKPRCHSFIRAGRWEFLTDSTHALAGQTVPMVPLPEWLREETRP